MDCRLQVSCSGLWEFAVPYSSQVILKTKNIFLVFYSIYAISIKFWIFSKRKKILLANLFPKLSTVYCLDTPLTIQRPLKTSFDSQHVKRFQILLKSSWEHFYHISSSLWGKIIWKISPWLKFEIIGLFVNTWTADYKYRVPDCENLPFPNMLNGSRHCGIFCSKLIIDSLLIILYLLNIKAILCGVFHHAKTSPRTVFWL